MLQGVLIDLVPFGKEFESRQLDWMNGPMHEWWGRGGLISRSAYERRKQEQQDQPSQDRFIRFGMLTKTGVPIGVFVLAQIDAYNRTAEIGAGIGDPAYWGGGFGSDAMLLLTEYAFRWLDLRRLWLTTLGSNVRAQRQVQKCGFKLEGSRHRGMTDIHGNDQDFLYYGLLREEWPGLDTMVEQLGLREKASGSVRNE
jgi:RimJ/RimL family protein N-acetyltransferase